MELAKNSHESADGTKHGPVIRRSTFNFVGGLQKNARTDAPMNKAFGVSMIEQQVDTLEKPDARRSPRRRVVLDAQIITGSSQAIPVKVESISASGVFAQAAALTLDVGAAVEFVLPCRRRGESLKLRMPATIVRLEQNGVALRFGRYDSDVYTDLIALIY
jgi:hypothetical protein